MATVDEETERFRLPGTQFMRRSREPRVWHLTPQWIEGTKYTLSRCRQSGPWLIVMASVPTREIVCPDCLATVPS